MLYVYSPNGPFESTDEYMSRYPGDEYVDILGYAINDLMEDDDDFDYSSLSKSMFGM